MMMIFLLSTVTAITPQAPRASLLSQACLAPPLAPNDHPLPADTQSLLSPASLHFTLPLIPTLANAPICLQPIASTQHRPSVFLLQLSPKENRPLGIRD